MTPFSEFKDRDPVETVEFIKNIFKKRNIEIIEERMLSHPGGIYSTGLYMPDMEIHTNGKGLSKDLCLASAWGEMIERYSSAIEEVENYEKDPDELKEKTIKVVNYTFDHYPAIKDDFCGKFYESFSKKESFNFDDFITNISTSYIYPADKMELVDFYDVKNDKNVKLCYRLMMVLAGTNGMSSGNTKEEALVEGFSEILERYAESVVRYKSIVPPEIPIDYIKEKAPNCFEIINQIEKEHDLKIKVVSLSLGKHLPVTGIIVTYNNSTDYYFQTGAHPVFRISLERCLTELLQGGIETKRVSLNYDTLKNLNSYKNYRNLVCTKISPASLTLFESNCSYDFEDCDISDGYSNEKGFDYLKNILLTLSDTFYIKDISHTEQPAFFTYVPGISCQLGYYPCFDGYCIDKFNYAIIRCCFNDEDVSIFDKQFFLAHRDKIKSSIPLKEGYVFASLYIEIGDYIKAANEVKQMEIQNEFTRAIALDLDMRACNISEEQRNQVIYFFFEDAEGIINDELDLIWRKPNTFESLISTWKEEIND